MTLNIFGQKIKVKKIKGLINSGIAGQYLILKQEIQLDHSLKGKEIMHTLMHEMLHAYIRTMGIDQAIQSQLEEVLCDQIPAMLLENLDIKLKK